MKHLKKLSALLIALVIAMSVSVMAFAAANWQDPAEILAEVTGRTVESIAQQRYDERKSYVEIAREEGKYEEFRSKMQENRKAEIEQRVKDGTLTREQADRALNNMENGGYGFDNSNGGYGNCCRGGNYNRSGGRYGMRNNSY